jgi:hypothetical protein
MNSSRSSANLKHGPKNINVTVIRAMVGECSAVLALEDGLMVYLEPDRIMIVRDTQQDFPEHGKPRLVPKKNADGQNGH